MLRFPRSGSWSDGSGGNVCWKAMRLLEASWRLPSGGILDVVVAAAVRPFHALRPPRSRRDRRKGRTEAGLQSGVLAHSPCDGMVCARGIAAHAQSANHLAVLIESEAAAEGDDFARNLVETRMLRIKGRVEGVRVVQPIKRSARLRGSIKVCGRDGELAVAEAIPGECLGQSDCAASRPGVIFTVGDNRADHALAVDDGGPHQVWLEQSAIAILYDLEQLFLHAFNDASVDGARSKSAVGGVSRRS